MKTIMKKMSVLMMMVMMMAMMSMPVYAAENAEAAFVEIGADGNTNDDSDNPTGDKAMAAAVAVGLAAAAGAIGMGMAIAKSVEGISRQPEAEGKIRTTLMLGLVFVETAIIYALIVAILIIFVL